MISPENWIISSYYSWAFFEARLIPFFLFYRSGSILKQTESLFPSLLLLKVWYFETMGEFLLIDKFNSDIFWGSNSWVLFSNTFSGRLFLLAINFSLLRVIPGFMLESIFWLIFETDAWKFNEEFWVNWTFELLLTYFYRLFYLKSWPSLLLERLDYPTSELLFI